jgi:hypothetical protein
VIHIYQTRSFLLISLLGRLDPALIVLSDYLITGTLNDLTTLESLSGTDGRVVFVESPSSLNVPIFPVSTSRCSRNTHYHEHNQTGNMATEVIAPTQIPRRERLSAEDFETASIRSAAPSYSESRCGTSEALAWICRRLTLAC